MSLVRFLAGLLLAAALQAAATQAMPAAPRWIDLFLIVTLVTARRGRPEVGLFAGLVAGWAADALAGSPFGFHGLADSTLGYAAAVVAQNLVVTRSSSIAGLFALAAAAQAAILALLVALFAAAPATVAAPDPWSIGARIVTTPLLGLVWIHLSARVGRRWRRRRGAAGADGDGAASLLR